MTSDSDDPTIDDPRFATLLASCLEAVERGEPIDGDRLRRESPEYADRILEFLELQAELREVGVEASSNGTSAHHTGVRLSSPSTNGQPPLRVRYFGDYLLLEEVGRGGMGVVYKARQQRLGRVVAVKMILTGRLANELDIRRFEREARAAANLSHPNIVSVHEVGEHEGQHFFSMDYVDGENLSALLRERPLSARRAAEAVSSVARAIDYSHQQGTLHRDLKPSNILFDRGGVPHITDFGLAKLVERDLDDVELTTTGQVIGTPSYMSPEQAASNHDLVGPASDIYSLGTILYACLTSRPPFAADSVADTLHQVIYAEPVPPRLLNPDMPRDLETICLKCLSKEPHRRYGTAAELADDLDRFLEGRPVLARPLGPISKSIRWCRRNRAVASLLAAVAASLLAGTAVSTYFAFEAERRADSEAQQKTRAVRSEQEKHAALEQESLARMAAEQARDEAARSLEQSQWNVYKMQLFPMLFAWRAGQFGKLESLLEASAPAQETPDFRGWEWYFFDDEVRRRSHVLVPQPSGYRFVVLAPDGGRMALRRRDGQIDIRQTVSLERERTIPGGGQLQLAWRSDGTLLAAPAGRNTVEIWDVESGELVRRFQTSGDPTQIPNRGIAFDPEGNRVALGGEHRVDIFDVDGEGVRTLKAPKFPVTQIDWHPKESLIAVGGDSNVALVAIDSDSLEWDFFRSRVPVHDIEWNRQGTHLASTWGAPFHSLRVLTRAGKWRQFHGHQQDPTAVAWDDGGLKLLSASRDQTVRLWDHNARNPSDLLEEVWSIHGSPIESLDWDLSSNTIVTVDLEGRLRSFKPLPKMIAPIEFQIPGPVRFATTASWLRSCPHNADLFACGSYQSILVLKISDQRVVSTISSDTFPVAGNVHGDPQNERPQHGGGITKKLQQGHAFTGFGWHPQKMQIATLDHAGRLIIWNAETGKPQQTLQAGSRSYTLSPQWSPDGRYLSAGSGQRWPGVAGASVDFWHADTGEHLGSLDSARRSCLGAWNPDSRQYAVLSSQDGGSVRIWDVDKSRLVAESRPLPRFMNAMTYSPNGGLIAIGGESGEIFFLDSQTADVVLEVLAHTGPLLSLAFSPDGRRVVSNSQSRELKLWDTGTGEELIVFGPSGKFGEIADWTCDGRHLITLSERGLVQVLGSERIGTPDPSRITLETGRLARYVPSADEYSTSAGPSSPTKDR